MDEVKQEAGQQENELEQRLRAGDLATVETGVALLERLAAQAVAMGFIDAAKGTRAAVGGFEKWAQLLRDDAQEKEQEKDHE